MKNKKEMEDRNTKTNNDGGEVKRSVAAACDVEALQKCLAENKGDSLKCQAQIEAFKAACSLKKTTPSYSLSPRPRPGSNAPTATSLVTEL